MIPVEVVWIWHLNNDQECKFDSYQRSSGCGCCSSIFFGLHKHQWYGKYHKGKPIIFCLKSHTERDIDTLSIHWNLTAQSPQLAVPELCGWISLTWMFTKWIRLTVYIYTEAIKIIQHHQSNVLYIWIVCLSICLSFVHILCLVQFHFTLYYVYIFVISVKEEIKSTCIYSSDFCQLLITFTNILDPDQVLTCIDPNRLTLCVCYWNILKVSRWQ